VFLTFSVEGIPKQGLAARERLLKDNPGYHLLLRWKVFPKEDLEQGHVSSRETHGMGEILRCHSISSNSSRGRAKAHALQGYFINLSTAQPTFKPLKSP
jgi:hypothetical protein